MNKKKKIIILISMLALIIIYYKFIAGDSYIDLYYQRLPIKVQNEFRKKDYKRIHMIYAKYKYKNVRDYKIDRHLFFKNENLILKSIDPIVTYYADSSYMVLGSGPVTFDSGLRFFYLPDYENIYILETKTGKILEKLFFTKEIRNAMIISHQLFLEFDNGKFGGVPVLPKYKGK